MENGTFFDEDYFDSLLADDRDVLKDAGKISHKIACDKALCEYEKYRVIQDQEYISTMDEFYNKYLEENKSCNES